MAKIFLAAGLAGSAALGLGLWRLTWAAEKTLAIRADPDTGKLELSPLFELPPSLRQRGITFILLEPPEEIQDAAREGDVLVTRIREIDLEWAGWKHYGNDYRLYRDGREIARADEGLRRFQILAAAAVAAPALLGGLGALIAAAARGRRSRPS